MTTGTQVSDQRTYTMTSCGNALAGDYWYKSWSGVDSAPGSRDRVTDHPYTLSILKLSDPLITWRTTASETPRTGTVSSCFGGVPTLPIPWDSNDELKLIGKISSKIRGNDFNGDAFIAEGHQTLKLLATTANRLAGFLENVRHGNIYKAARYLGGPKVSSGRSKIYNALKRELKPNGKSTGSLQNAILEVQYGWRPLLSDAHEFGTALAEIYTKTPHEFYKVKRKKVVSAESPMGGGVIANCRTTKTVWLKITVSRPPGTRQILHMNDPLAAAWEFTPWSFIADWFIPIGSWLTAVNTLNVGGGGLQITSVLRSEKITTDGIVLNGGQDYIILSNPGFRSSTVHFDRSIGALHNYTDVPLPSFKPLRKVFSPEHCLNAFALLTSVSNGFTKSLKF